MKMSESARRAFGDHVRQLREERRRIDGAFSLRKVAERVGIEPGYLSRIERWDVDPPADEKIIALANVLGADPDVLLAMAGRIHPDLVEIIGSKPRFFATLLRQLRDAPDEQREAIAALVRDGNW
jgi:transcriptional regulator with XRE-family HTH domain